MTTASGASIPPHRPNMGAFAPLPPTEKYGEDIWHFTDPWALESMVRQKQLWATAATMLNDPQELIVGAKRIEQWYKKSSSELPDDRQLHKQLRGIFNDKFAKSILKSPAYLVCASTDFRVLNQWRNYGGTTGVAIKLSAGADLIPENPPIADGFTLIPQWTRVLYAHDEQDDRIRRVLTWIAEGPIKGPLQSSDQAPANELIRGVLAALAASMKDSAYAEEKEVRLIAYPPTGSSPLHRGSNRGVIPYIRINHHKNFAWDLALMQGLSEPNAPLPIEIVRVGPPDGASEEQRIIGVRSLLRANESMAPVKGSTIKYLPA